MAATLANSFESIRPALLALAHMADTQPSKITRQRERFHLDRVRRTGETFHSQLISER